MCNMIFGTTVTAVGVVLVAAVAFIGYGIVPGVIDRRVIDEVVLHDDTPQMDMFKQVPFLLDFKIFIFNIENPDEVLQGGVPVVKERGPYVYKLNQTRLVDELDGDRVRYRRLLHFDFDAEASHPHKEDDIITITNVAYHGLLQVAEILIPRLLSTQVLNLMMPTLFGANNSPILKVKFRDLVLDGVPICENTGILGDAACSIIRTIARGIKNVEEMPDGSLRFSLLGFKQNLPSNDFLAYRGLEDTNDLGEVITYNGSAVLKAWVNEVSEVGDTMTSVCNVVRGTDAGIFHPFIERDESLYSIDSDICRTVELRYEQDGEYEGIPVVRYTGKEWVFDNNEGCYCLNITKGVTNSDGCLLRGAMELYSCLGANMVISFPHFLFADFTYRNGIVGLSPSEDKHGLFVDLEPITGTIIRGQKRAQFNIFVRPVESIPSTQVLRSVLMPILWVQEGMDLPPDYVDMVKNRLLRPINFVSILIPVLIAVFAVIALVGAIIIIRVKCTKNPPR